MQQKTRYARHLIGLPSLQEFSQNVVVRLMKTPASRAPITRLAKRHGTIAVMNKARFCDPGADVRKKNEYATSLFLQTGRSLPLPASSKHNERKRFEKKQETSCFFRSSWKKCGSSNYSSDDYEVDIHNKYTKGVNVQHLLNTHFTKARNLHIYFPNIQS